MVHGKDVGRDVASPPSTPPPPDEEGASRGRVSFGAESIGAMDKSMKPKFELQMRDAREFSCQCRKEHAHKFVSCNADLRSNIDDCDGVRNIIQRVTKRIALLFNIRIQFLP